MAIWLLLNVIISCAPCLHACSPAIFRNFFAENTLNRHVNRAGDERDSSFHNSAHTNIQTVIVELALNLDWYRHAEKLRFLPWEPVSVRPVSLEIICLAGNIHTAGIHVDGLSPSSLHPAYPYAPSCSWSWIYPFHQKEYPSHTSAGFKATEHNPDIKLVYVCLEYSWVSAPALTKQERVPQGNIFPLSEKIFQLLQELFTSAITTWPMTEMPWRLINN